MLTIVAIDRILRRCPFLSVDHRQQIMDQLFDELRIIIAEEKCSKLE